MALNDKSKSKITNAKQILAFESIQKNSVEQDIEKRKNTINAVNDILRVFLEPGSADKIKTITRAQQAASLEGGKGMEEAKDSKYLPSFNVRTPVVKIKINGTEIYPRKYILGEENTAPENAKLNFQTLNLSIPMGIGKNFTGSITLFTKNPAEILGYINSGKNTIDGWPTMTIQFGWAFSDSSFTAQSDIQVNTESAMSPELTYLITNIGMEDPGVLGTTFTLSLQEVGTVVLQHSTDDIIFDANYPQQQLRALLEGYLHIRLFTLDDLLYFNEYNTETTQQAAQAIKNISAESLVASHVVNIPTNTSTTAPTIANENKKNWIYVYNKNYKQPEITDSFLNLICSNAKQYTYTNFYVNSTPEFFTEARKNDLSVRPVDRMHNGRFVKLTDEQVTKLKLGPAGITKDTLGTPVSLIAGKSGPANVFFPDGVPPSIPQPENTNAKTSDKKTQTSTDTTKTFFTNVPNAAVGVNNRNFRTVADDLASQCRCRWFPHNNVDLLAQDKKDSETNVLLNKLGSDLKLIRNQTKNNLSAETFNSLIVRYPAAEESNILSAIQNIGESGNIDSKTAVVDLLETQIKANMAKLATRSRLYYIPNVPVSWNTTGSILHSTNLNVNVTGDSKPEPYDEGAYFLLPDLLDDYDIFTQDLPLDYGPGASNLPYFYGSGQNVFQASLGQTQPAMFGEVLSLSVNHSNLIAQLAASADEDLAYAIDGSRLTSLEIAKNFSMDKTKTRTLDSDTSDATKKRNAERGAKPIESGKAQRIATRRRFRNSLGLGTGNLFVGDDKALSGQDKSRQSSDPGGPVETASLKIKSRVSTFLRWPTEAKITILGDPNLLKLGPGCFELFSYYPVEHEDGSVTQTLNALTSGVYLVTKVEHSINMGDFTTTLSGIKAVDPTDVPSSITNKIRKEIAKEPKIKDGGSNVVSDNLDKQVTDVNLNDAQFTGGFLSHELKNVLENYRNQHKAK